MFQVDEFVQNVGNGKLGKQEASELFSRLSPDEKKRVLSDLEQQNTGQAANGMHSNASFSTSSGPSIGAPLSVRTNQNCTEHQRVFIDGFVAERSAQTKASKKLAAGHRSVLADQRTPANFNILLKDLQYPLTIQRATGAYIEDVDGNRYIDIAGDFGVNLFGHAPSFLQEALKGQLDAGWALCGRYGALGEAAELFCELTGHDRVAFCQSGTESLICAVRLARAHTDREKIALFGGSYHGHADIFLNPFMPGVSEASAEEVLALGYGSEEALAAIEAHAGELAAVVVEPVQSDRIDLQPREFLHKLRQVTARHGIVLIFDEMITGFRAHMRGCQGLFGVEADLATYGKILGGGITAGAVAGRAEIMNWCDGGNWQYGDDSKPGPSVYIAGTHTQNPLKMASTLAVLRALKQMPSLAEDLAGKTEGLCRRINEFASSMRLPFETIWFRSQFKFRFASRQFSLTQALFLHLLQARGVNYHLHGNCFLTTAHSDTDIDEIVHAVCDSLSVLAREGFFFDSADDRTSKGTHEDDLPALSRSRTVPSDNLEPPAVARVAPVKRQVNRAEVVSSLKSLVERFLELAPDEFTEEDDLANLGVDSIILTGILKAISTQFGVKLSFKKLGGAQTINEVAEVLCEELGNTSPLLEEGAIDVPPPLSDEDASTQNTRHFPLDAQENETSQERGYDQTPAQEGKVRQLVDSDVDPNSIAIIGMSGVFGPAEDLNALWQTLMDGETGIGEVPASRWDWKSLSSQIVEDGATPWRWGSFVDAPGCFDPLFFSISPREAKYMDPQERLLLMQSYKAMEDAGLRASTLDSAKVGVFVGYEYTDYAEYMREVGGSVPDLDPSLCDLSGRPWNLANRISYVFNWKGPSEAVNVNCAGSAVSINRGCQSLAIGETDLVLAGGVCLNLLPSSYLNVADLLSPNGQVDVLGADANGYVKGEGCGVIVLKRLADALRDGDPVYAVIVGARQSYRGKGNSLSEIRSDAITTLIGDCQDKAGVDSADLRYIEVNGFCTIDGDAAEYEGIRAAVPTDGVCQLGSLKANLGNLEPVSGVAGVIKVALAMEKGVMPPTITRGHKTNAQTDLGQEDGPLHLSSAPTPLEKLRACPGQGALAGVNSFADSGVNVHILLQEAQAAQEPSKARWTLERYVFVLSAKTRAAFAEYARNWLAYLAEDPSIDLSRLTYTLQTGREAFAHRLACTFGNLSELHKQLEDIVSGTLPEGCFIGPSPDTQGKPLPTGAAGLAALWVEGHEVEWGDYYEGGVPAALHLLPTYPFNLKRYWVERPETGVAGLSEGEPAPVSIAGEVSDDRVPDLHSNGMLNEPEGSAMQSGTAAAMNCETSATAPPRPAMSAAPLPSDRGNDIAGNDGDDARVLQITKKVRSIVLDFLEIEGSDEIDEAANFAEIGLTSISIVLLIDEVNRQFGLELPEIVVFDYPNIIELSQHIATLVDDVPQAVAVQSTGQQAASGKPNGSSNLDGILARIESQSISIDEALALIDEQASVPGTEQRH